MSSPSPRRSVLKIVGINVLIFFGLLLLLEATGQLIAIIYPSYDVLFLQPDQNLGWKQVPNFNWTWTGFSWYAAEFSVEVESNVLGFRDVVRKYLKPTEVVRVAVFGDSFIEAVQVPSEMTAAQLLEQRLNALQGRGPEGLQKWEVLNFGISNYGIGQYLLTWEQYAKHYSPDYAVIFVSGLQMKRTVDRYELGTFSVTRGRSLWIRPTFRLDADRDLLIREPARDFEEFVAAQKDVIQTDFAGKRIRRKQMRSLTLYYSRYLSIALARLAQSIGTGSNTRGEIASRNVPYLTDSVLAINLIESRKIL